MPAAEVSRRVSLRGLAISLVILPVLAVGLRSQPFQVPERGLGAITEQSVRACVAYLAADRMQGRDTPSPELDSCAVFLATRLRAAGLEAFLQPFNLLRTRLGEPSSVMLTVDGKHLVYRLRRDFVPVHLSGSGEVEAAVAFAGYGITAPEYGYDDYAAVEPEGKVVLVFTHEPQERDSSSVFDGAHATEHSTLQQKVWNAHAHGAVGVLVVTDPNNHRLERPASEWTSSGPGADGWSSFTVEECDRTPLLVMRVGKRLAEDLLAPSGRSLSRLQAEIDSTLAPQSFVVPGVKVRMCANLEKMRFPTQNVVAVLRGGDPKLRDEAVVIGAHYDHIGARNDTLVFNGADDNASGTAGLVAIAEAFASLGVPPRRSVVFVAFAGEEKGLYGSRFYVANPVFPLCNTVAMLNMDMIGRNDTAAVEVDGTGHFPWLRDLVEAANATVGLRLRYSSRKAAPASDATPFYWRRVAALNFTSGLHSDYHQPSDDVDKLALPHLVDVARLVFGIAWLLANEDLPHQVAQDPHAPLLRGSAGRQSQRQ